MKWYSLLMIIFFSITIVSAGPYSSSINQGPYSSNINKVETLFNNNTASVNSSDYWNTNLGSLDNANATQLENNGGTLSIMTSWLTSFGNNLWCQLTGCIMEGDINMDGNDILMQGGNINNTHILSFNETVCTDTDNLVEGDVCWNPDDHTLNIVTGLNGNVIQVGQEVIGIGINKDGSDLSDGTVVASAGFQGDRMTFIRADGSNVSRSAMIGVLTHNCLNNQECAITVFGFVRGLNTSMWSSGDKLYINSSSTGKLTNLVPTLPNNPIWVATAGVIHEQVGTIFINPSIDPGDGFLINSIYATSNITASNFIGGGGYFDNINIINSTAGSVLFVGSDLKIAEDNSNLFWDTVNKRLGIGTDSPDRKLEVSGQIRLGVGTPDASGTIDFTTSANNGRTTFYNSVNPSIYTVSTTVGDYPFAGRGNLVFEGRTDSARDIVFVTGTGGVPKVSMVVKGSNNYVGIGTDNPKSELHVSGTDTISEIKIGAVTDTLANLNARISLQENANTDGSIKDGTVITNSRIDVTGTFSIHKYEDSVDVGGIDIDRSGNVGINVVNPTAQLSVTNGLSSQVALNIKGAVSQSADLLQIQDSSDNVLTHINSEGNLILGRDNLSTGTSTFYSGALAGGQFDINHNAQAYEHFLTYTDGGPRFLKVGTGSPSVGKMMEIGVEGDISYYSDGQKMDWDPTNFNLLNSWSFKMKNTASDVVANIEGTAGRMGLGTAFDGATQLLVKAYGYDDIGIVVQEGSQSANTDLMQFWNSSKNILTKIDYLGDLTINTLTASKPVWTDANKKLVSKDIVINAPVSLETYDPSPARSSESDIHGGLQILATAQPLDSVPTNIVISKGTGRVLISVNAGSDIVGDITITGTSVDRNTGATTGADTDTISVDSLTVDTSTTDANGNTKYSGSEIYVSSKWFTGTVTLSTTNLTLTDVDVYHLSYEQFDDKPNITIDTFDQSIYTTNVAAEFDSYLQSIEVTGNKAVVELLAEHHVGASGETALANKYWRLRKGNINKSLDGTTDGVWITTHYSNSPAYVEDVSMKVWGTEAVTAY